MDDRGHTGKLTVGIVGAGFSGLSVAHYLRKYSKLQSFVIYESSLRTEGGAGTWKENNYPGCACDVPIHLYQLSWAKWSTWTEYLPLQREIQKYMNEITHEHGLYRHIQFATRVEEAIWIDSESVWELTLRNVGAADPDVAVYTVRHHVVVMCTGALSQTRMPQGLDAKAFTGTQFHSSNWRHDIALENKRVAVVGNGCSATQLLPIIARRTKLLTQFIPSPQWYAPRDNYLYGDLQKFCFRYLPGWMWLYRMHMAITWDQDAWKFGPGEKSARKREGIESMFLEHMKANAPEKYWKQLTPSFPMGCKRLVLDSSYYRSLNGDNVEPVFTRVVKVTETGLVGKDGSTRDFDIIIWATGFLVTSPFADTKVYGRSGEELHQKWEQQGAPSTYAGMTVPDYPNFYMTAGPGSLPGHYSLTTIIEIQAQWIAQMITLQAENDVESFEVTQAAHLDYNTWLQHKIKNWVFASKLCTSWFKTKDGTVATHFPGTVLMYWIKTFYPDMRHMHQRGGRRYVAGKTISREVRKYTFAALTAAAICYLIKSKHW